MDRILGEPRRFHPLVGFGWLASRTETWLYSQNSLSDHQQRWRGFLAVVILLAPLYLCCSWLSSLDLAGQIFQVGVLYLAIGGRSLVEHAARVVVALQQDGLAKARQQVGYLVSRETGNMDEAAVVRATVESILENSCDAIFAALFWFLLLGAPGALLLRLANTLDAMWGYRNDRYHAFGWAAARLDDLLGLIPARLTALTFILMGNTRGALRAWRECPERKSPNATLVMATGAGALDLRLGGVATYDGRVVVNPMLGHGLPAQIADIARAIALVRRGEYLWIVAAFLLGVASLA